MKRFLLQFNSWSGNSYWEFLHESNTEEQFKQDVNHLLKTHAEDYFKSTVREFPNGKVLKGHVLDYDWIRFILPFLKNMGYREPLDFDGVYYFGEIGIIDGEEYKREEEDYKQFESIVGTELMRKAEACNNENNLRK